MKKLNLLILNPDLPIFPGRAGHEFLHSTNLTRMAQKVGLVSLVHTREQYEKKQGLADAGIELYLWENPDLNVSPSGNNLRPSVLRRVGKTIYSLILTGLRRPLDTAVQDFQFGNISAHLLQAFSRDKWQAVIVVQSSCARWYDFLPPDPAKILVLHDVRALMYERQAETAASFFHRLVYLFQAGLYRRFEGKYCRKYDLVITVSSTDEDWVRQHYRPSQIVTVPIPVDGSYFRQLTTEPESRARVLFTGTMNHPPNTDAACFFAHQVFPKIRNLIADAEFFIVGRDPSPAVAALNDLPGVTVTGFVPDIREHIARATVVVVPLRFGSGMRNKILEAWGMKKCVVSTTIGAEGLNYQDGENILIADDAQSFANKVIQTLQEPQLREKLRTGGRELIKKQHHPELLARRYYQTVAGLVKEKRQASMPMRVVIDLRWMRPGEAGGIENLSRSFLKCLIRLDASNRYTLMVRSETKYDFDLRHHPNFRLSLVDGPGFVWGLFFRHFSQKLHRLLRVPHWRSAGVQMLCKLNALNAEIVLSIPGFIHPELYPLTNVLIVPDIQHEYHPEFFFESELRERRRIYTDSIKHADQLCAISEFTRQTLIERLGVNPERVTTTHLAADPIFHPQSPCRGDRKKVLEKYGLPSGQYLFFPANTWPHKNHRAALKALKILSETYKIRPLLVCTGKHKNAQAGLSELIKELKLDRQTKFLGYCPSIELPALYQGAAALLFPSLFEGFGMPVLEAMWCDCPVVCSNATSLPEIAEDAALLVDPHSPEEIAHAISLALGDEQLRLSLIKRGRKQAEKFSWQKFSVEIIRTLYKVREKQLR